MEKVTLSVLPGICGFRFKIIATRKSRRAAGIKIVDSECSMLNEFGARLSEVTLFDIFKPHTKNPVYEISEQVHCHLCCPVSIAIIKASEVVLDLALPQDVSIHFE